MVQFLCLLSFSEAGFSSAVFFLKWSQVFEVITLGKIMTDILKPDISIRKSKIAATVQPESHSSTNNRHVR